MILRKFRDKYFKCNIICSYNKFFHLIYFDIVGIISNYCQGTFFKLSEVNSNIYFSVQYFENDFIFPFEIMFIKL